MSISKNQAVLAGIGGVTLVAAVVLGYFAFDAYSRRSESAEALEVAESSVQRLLRAEISPDNASVAAVKKNRDAVAGWTEAALSTASVGDRAVRADVNEAAFKQKLVDDARELAQLPGGVDGKIVKADFAFGFPDFITGDKLPEKERLERLQRQWGDICFIVEQLADCGVTEIVRVEPLPAAPTAEKKEEKPRARARTGKAAAPEKPDFTCERYAFDFRARPAALVKAVNALATAERFVAADSFSFSREGDMIVASLGEGEKAAAAAPAGGGRRRRRRAAEEQSAEETGASAENPDEAKKGVVNDPAQELPFLVRTVLSVYDFGSAEKAAADGTPAAGEAEKAEDAAKEDEE